MRSRRRADRGAARAAARGNSPRASRGRSRNAGANPAWQMGPSQYDLFVSAGSPAAARPPHVGLDRERLAATAAARLVRILELEAMLHELDLVVQDRAAQVHEA